MLASTVPGGSIGGGARPCRSAIFRLISSWIRRVRWASPGSKAAGRRVASCCSPIFFTTFAAPRMTETTTKRKMRNGSAFEILSIDIADVDVGENVGAKLQEAQAEANKSIAQAQAEIRRAAAVAVEQEMKARVQEMQAKVVEAQAQVPLAMAEAFRSGRLGIMDYYKMENIQADTAMRGSIAHPEGKK